MKKILYILTLSAVFIMLYTLPVHAATGTYIYIREFWSSYSNKIIYSAQGYSFNSPTTVTNGYIPYFAYGHGPIEGDTPSEAISNWQTYYGDYTGYNYNGTIGVNESRFKYIIVTSGTINFSGDSGKVFGSMQEFEDFLNPPPTPTPAPAWYTEMWDTLKEELGNPAFWFGEWFIDIIDSIFGNEDENEPTGPPKPPTSTHVQINNPSLTPAPTPIPYTTIIIPKTDPVSGDTYYETNYYYTNPSGTPIITTSPPTNTPSQNGPSDGTNYSPVDPMSIPQLPWLTTTTIGDDDLDGMSSISQGIDSIDEVAANYNDGMSVVQDATGTLPVSWLLLIGIAAAIPLVAGIISRFLS